MENNNPQKCKTCNYKCKYNTPVCATCKNLYDDTYSDCPNCIALIESNYCFYEKRKENN